MSYSKFNKTIILIFIGALVLRLLYVLLAVQLPIIRDSSLYDNLGITIARGDGFSNTFGDPTTQSPPLYPFILAIFYRLFGHSYLAVRIFQSLISASFCLLIYKIAKSLINEKIATWASILCALHPAFISYSGRILTEITAAFLLLMFVLLLHLGLNKGKLWFYVLSGIFLGLLILCRQDMLLLLVILPSSLVLIYRSEQKIFLRALTVTLIAVVTIFPWSLRNYVLFNEIIPVARGGGAILWHATHPAGFVEWQGTSEYEPAKSLIKDLDFTKEETHLYLNKILLKEGLRNIKLHPFIYMKSCTMHLGRFLIGSHSNSFVITKESFKEVINKKRFGVLILKAFLLITNSLLVFLSILGIFKLRKKFKHLFPALLPIFYVAFIHTIFFGTVRYQVQILALGLMFSAVGIESICRRVSTKRCKG